MMKNINKCMLIGLLTVSGALNAMNGAAAGFAMGIGAPVANAGANVGGAGLGAAPAGGGAGVGAREVGPIDSFSGGLNKGIEKLGALLVFGSAGYVLNKTGEWIKATYFEDTSNLKKLEAEARTRELNNHATEIANINAEIANINTEIANINAEIDMEYKKITAAQNEAARLAEAYPRWVNVYNGGINTGQDKKKIQADIDKALNAQRASSDYCILVTQAVNERIKALEQIRTELKEKAKNVSKKLKLADLQGSGTVSIRKANPALAATLLAKSANRGA